MNEGFLLQTDIENKILENEISKKLLELCNEETELFLVGGFLRDFFITQNKLYECNKKDCLDLDYVIKGESAAVFARKAADLFNGYFVLLDKEHDIARVVMPDKKSTLDFAQCVGSNIEEDLRNRDFRINSIACKIERENTKIIDPLGGIGDIQHKIIKAVSEKNITEDPLRMLRAFRHSAQTGFEIEKHTIELVERHKQLINSVSIERISQELIKLFEGDFTADNLHLMLKTGLFEKIFPEIEPQKDIPPNLHHHLCLIDHSVEVVRQLENTVKSSSDNIKIHLNREFSPSLKALPLLKIAALLHDIGKPQTWSIDEEGRHRFIKHEEVGSFMVIDLLKRLKFSKNSSKYISKLVKFHLYPSQLINEGFEQLSEKALMRMFRRIKEDTPELILLAMADRKSALGPEITEEVANRNINGLYWLLKKYFQYLETEKDAISLPKILDGREVMEILGIPASPLVGKVLKALHEARISGDILTKEEAVLFIQNQKE